MSIFISKQLKYFMVAMEMRCISKAADLLHLTRTPLCKKISDLENMLGEVLFTRKYNELIPTEYAFFLYRKLIPIYEAQLSLENKLNKKKRNGILTIYFDVTIPELFYRAISSFIENDIAHETIKFQRIVITETLLQEYSNERNVFFISFRPLTLCYPFRETMWNGSEATLLIPKCNKESTDFINIYIWDDNFSSYFKERIHTTLKNKYELIEFTHHNNDLSVILHKIYLGNGSSILPLKTALAYKSEFIDLSPIKEKHISVYMYNNEHLAFKAEFDKVKKILLTYI